MLFAENSAGALEKISNSDNRWYETELSGMIIEGSKFIAIEPSENYSILASFYIDNDTYEDETGTYRLRIDYYTTTDGTEKITPFSDYSNIFEISAD